MFNLVECAMVLNNASSSGFNKMSYNNETNTGTMDFLGTLSPASSTVDTHDKMNSPLSPTQLLYNSDIMVFEGVDLNMPYMEIIEQPVEKFRFRYKSEMVGTHGSLTGMSSDKIRKNTFPTVRLHNYNGNAILRCSLYQMNVDEPHAHRLVVRAGNEEKDDPHDIEALPEHDYTVVFQGMGIMHTAKKHLATELIKKKLRLLKERLLRDDIFRKLTHKEEAEIHQQCEDQAKKINLNTVRLKFEAFSVDNSIHGITKLKPICPPVYSHGINNLKSALTGELKIVRMDHSTTSCTGGQEIFILVEKVTKNNIKVRFFETDEDGKEIWSDYGRFSHIDVHHQYAIVFKAPPYKDLNIDKTVEVCIELERPSDGARSDPRIFKYKPTERIGSKRSRYDSMSSCELPTTINHMSFGSSTLSVESLLLRDPGFFDDSNNFNSNEFAKIVDRALSEYAFLSTDGPEDEDPKIPTKIIDGRVESLAKRVVSELGAFLKCDPSPERVESLVKKLFSITEKGNTALHSSIVCEQYSHLQYIMVLLSKMQHLKLADKRNDKGETPLHLAVVVNNPTIVDLLLPVGANANIVDNKGNTALHLAVRENYNLLDYLKLVKSTDLDLENHDGYTALLMAIRNGNLNSVKILVEHKADANKCFLKDGNTPLHVAIEEKQVHIVKYLLEDANARVDIENYNKITPAQLSKFLSDTDEPDPKEIYDIITKFVDEHGFESLLIKTEIDDESCDSDLVIKSEPMSPMPPDMFDLDNTFGEYCIDVLSPLLDGTPILRRLAKDLEFEPIASSLNNITTRMLLYYANTTGKTPTEIRQLLMQYGEHHLASSLSQSSCVKKI